jgi:hypothetical protein
MIKLTSLLKEQRYKYKWVPLQQALPANAVNGYRLKYKERGEGALVDESDLKYIFSDSRFATKYKNKDYVFYISEVRGTSKKKVYIAYVYRRDNLPANIKLFFTLGIGPTFTLNGVPVFLSSQEKEVAGKGSGTGSEETTEEERIAAEKAAEKAAAEQIQKAEAEAKKAGEEERITAGYKISQRIQKIAKDLYDAANEGILLPGTNEKLFDSAFDQIKSKSDVHGVDLEIARLEANSKKNLEAYINSEFSWNDKDIRLEKLAKLVGKREDGEIVKTPTSLMQQAAAEGKQESLANRKLPGQGFPTGPKV